jgi:hypothetical protein
VVGRGVIFFNRKERRGGRRDRRAFGGWDCVLHTRSQTRTRSDTARGFTASLIYAALSGLGVVGWGVIFFNRKEHRGGRRGRRGAQDFVF